jgi:hypothetical protein
MSPVQHSKVRHIAAAGAVALIATVPMAACGGRSVSPLPAHAADDDRVAAPSQASSPDPGASFPVGSSPPGVASAPAGARPAKTKTVKLAPPTPTSTRPVSSCLGAVRYDLDLRNTVLDLVKSLCFHSGGVLRLQGIGPGLVTATPESLRAYSYEAGVVDLRFLRPGTVTVTIPQDEKTYTIHVVVIS